MRYFLDTEFIEYPHTIDLISIALVAENGTSFYGVNDKVDWSKASPWVLENVKPHVGLTTEEVLRDWTKHLNTPGASPLPFSVKVRTTKPGIASALSGFIGDDPKPEFWSYYAAYDWVVFCWLFGTMDQLPKHFPQWCRDLKQLAETVGIEIDQKDSRHNALDDARWIAATHRNLTDLQWCATERLRVRNAQIAGEGD